MAKRDRYIRITCSEGRTQSLQTLGDTEDAQAFFERYKMRLGAVRSDISKTWLDGLTYTVKVNVWESDYSQSWYGSGWYLWAVRTHNNIKHSYYEFHKTDNTGGLQIGADSLSDAVETLTRTER